MKVEIINHDKTCVMLELDTVPRIGENVLVKMALRNNVCN